MCQNAPDSPSTVKNQTMRWKAFVLAGCLAFALCAFAFFTVARAQDDPEQPLRGVERDAPERDVEILSREPLAGGATQLVASIPAQADTYIASGRPNDNFNSDALFLGYNLTDDYGAQRTLLRFDVEGQIPSGSIINDAQLRLYLVYSSPANDTPMNTVLRRLASPWDEETVTWNSEPVWTDVDDTMAVGSALGWYEWEVTDVVSDWVNGVVDNNGVEIIGNETVQQRERAFYSREMLTDFYPQLIVDYTVTNDTTAPNVSVDALPDYSRRNFTVSWSGEDPGGAGIAHYDVQYRVDGGPWVAWQQVVTHTSAVFTGENGRFYEFRARAMDNVGNLEPFGGPEAATTVDNRAPVAEVQPLPATIGLASFSVSWTGDDQGGSGIQHYDVRYRRDGGPWTVWRSETTATSDIFMAPADGFYEFEARAVDNVGQVEPFSGEPEAEVLVTIVPPSLSWLPAVFRLDSD